MMMLLIPMLLLVVAEQASSEFDNIKKLALANNEFAFKLCRTLNSQENVIISPISIFTALAMLYEGGRDVTAEEMSEVLSFNTSGLGEENITQHFQEFFSLIGNSSDQYQLDIANAMISQSPYPVLEGYKDALEKYYDGIIKETNVSGEDTKIVDEINNWVKNKTEEKIQYLSKSIPNDTVLVVLNAFYFKGAWQTRFSRRHTKEESFYNDGVYEVSVQMMSTKSTFLYGYFEEYGFEAVKMPYKGEEISMLVLLPLQGKSLSKIEWELTSSTLDNITSMMKNQKFNVKIPKFKLKDRKQLKNNLFFLGMKSTFTNKANFTGISREGNLEVSKIIYRGVVEVNEKGSEAAGATVGSARYGKSRGRPKPGNFYANHPFVFLITDDRTGMILFYGRVNKL